MGTDRHFSLAQVVIQGLPGESALGDDGYHRHIQLFQQNAHFSGQRGGGAVKGIAGFRVHQHTDTLFFQQVFHIPNQRDIADEFLGGDTAKPPHQPAFAHKAVAGTDDAVPLGPEDPGRDHQVDKAGVIHQNQTRLVFYRFHTLGGIAKPGREQLRDGDQADHSVQQTAGTQGGAVLGRLFRQDLLIGKGLGLDFHQHHILYVLWDQFSISREKKQSFQGCLHIGLCFDIIKLKR